jgi:uncharacterized protein
MPTDLCSLQEDDRSFSECPAQEFSGSLFQEIYTMTRTISEGILRHQVHPESATRKLIHRGLLPDAPSFLQSAIHYETLAGSRAYGVADTAIHNTPPDFDVCGFAIPPKEMIFKHLTGWIPGFHSEPPGFDQWSRSDISEYLPEVAAGVNSIVQPPPNHDAVAAAMAAATVVSGTVSEMICMEIGSAPRQSSEAQHPTHPERVWDLQIFSIVRFFELGRQSSPNIIESLFAPEDCVLFCTDVGQLARLNRRLFLSCEVVKKFRAFARNQLKRLLNLRIQSSADSAEMYPAENYDLKCAYHVTRLLDQAEQVLLYSDLDLRNSRDSLREIRRGEWPLRDVLSLAGKKESRLDRLLSQTSLPDFPDPGPLQQLLCRCLESCYA